MRLGVGPELHSAEPIGPTLPGLYEEDAFTQRLTAAFDQALAPVFLTIDNLPAYLDPALTPEDFLEWLAGWVGVILDETWPIERRRAFVAMATTLYRERGTSRGLTDLVRIFTPGEVTVEESGAAAWSPTSDAAFPGSAGYSVLVRVTTKDPGTVDAGRLDALVAAAKPAHVLHRVEVVKG